MLFKPETLKRDFLRFMTASVSAQLVYALYTMIDGIFVANGVSEVALAAVNLVSPYINFLFSFSLMFSVGASTLASMHMGEGNQKEANRVFTQALALLFVIGIGISVFVLTNTAAFARFLGAREGTIDYAVEYLTMLAPFSVWFFIAYALEILVKADGNPKASVIAIIAGCCVHCVLDYILVIRLQVGVRGAAFATSMSQFVSFLVYLKHFLSSKANMRLIRTKPDAGLILRTCRIGLPSGLTELSAGLTTFLFNHAIVTYLSEELLAGYTIIAYINTIVVMCMTGVIQGAQPMISFFLGAGQRDLSRRLLRYSMISSVAIAAAIVVICELAAAPIVSLFIPAEQAALAAASVTMLRIYSLTFLFIGFNVIMAGYYTAVEKPLYSFIISVGRGGATLLVALAIMIALFGGNGIWWSALVAEILCLGITYAIACLDRRRVNG